jgi:hypothetical protein
MAVCSGKRRLCGKGREPADPLQGGISPGKAKKGTGASGFEADSCKGSFMRVTAGCHQSIGQKRAFRLTGKLAEEQ